MIKSVQLMLYFCLEHADLKYVICVILYDFELSCYKTKISNILWENNYFPSVNFYTEFPYSKLLLHTASNCQSIFKNFVAQFAIN